MFSREQTPHKTKIIVFVFLGLSLCLSNTVLAQTQSDVDTRRASLERELVNLEAQIAEQRRLLTDKQKEAVSLERDIAILDAQIKKARLEIRARDIAISNLGTEIGGKARKITSLSEKIDRERQSLAALLRKTREIDSATFVELAMSGATVSDFFRDADQFEVIERELQTSFTELRETRQETEEEKANLETRRLEEVELKKLQELEERRLRERERERSNLLKATRGQEAAYKKVLAEQEKTAAQIRAELFQLRGTAAIPFGQALEYANVASSKTGVRPAFILGIIAEESNLGENVGTGTWTVDMHPTRDRPVFEYIARALGFDPNRMPVSKKPGYGWGGAMGPAQFIPSTWVCYGGFINTNTGDCDNKKRSLSWDLFWKGPWEYREGADIVRQLVGKTSPANPWEPKDAFMASALLLKENGAAAGTFAAERLAALRYFAGWANAHKAAYAFYGDDVMALAAKYQNQIDILQRN